MSLFFSKKKKATKKESNDTKETNDTKQDDLAQFIYEISNIQKLSPKIGYGLLVFSFFDIGTTIYPIQFTNPTWEFDFFGAMVETIALPLLGFVLIFMGGWRRRNKYERRLLRILSWLSLIICLSYIPLTALGISSVVRIDRQNNQILRTQLSQARAESEEIKQQLDQISTSAELRIFLTDFVDQDSPTFEDSQFDSIKQELVDSISQDLSSLENQEQSRNSQRRAAILRRAIRWTLGAFLAATLFFIIWKETAWARRNKILS